MLKVIILSFNTSELIFKKICINKIESLLKIIINSFSYIIYFLILNKR